MTAANPDRAFSKAPASTSAPVAPEKKDTRPSHSEIMLAVWERRWAEGRSGHHGGKPMPVSVKLREEKLAKGKELNQRGKVSVGRPKGRRG